jgi:N-acetylglucosaminyldiphosphoundecaprenol N-acetyl-beta-D-mannosaminyltransferase
MKKHFLNWGINAALGQIFRAFTDILLMTFAAGLSAFISLPLKLLAILGAAPAYKKVQIRLSNNEVLAVSIFEHPNILIRYAQLFPLVLRRKIRLVGTHLQMEDVLSSSNTISIEESTGVFSLYFIRRSARLANTSIAQCNKEYLDNHGMFKDISLILQLAIALILHQETPSEPDILDIFGIGILNVSMSEAFTLLEQGILNKEQKRAYFVNADCLNKVFIDTEYYHYLRNNKYVFPDGSGVNLAAKILGNSLKENVNGTDMLPHICDLAQDKGYRVYLLGAAPSVAEEMKEKLVTRYPKLQICGYRDGYFNWEEMAGKVIEEINAVSTDILLVALGAPLQERFIEKYGDLLSAKIILGVGGLFDFYSERIARAPMWMRQIGMEWIFRLIQEPKRMWRRYIIGNPLFIYRVYRWKKTGKKDIHPEG